MAPIDIDGGGGGGTVPDNPLQLQEISTYIGNIIEAAIPLVGIIAFIMLLVGGFTVLSSGGNPENTQKGKSIITYAIMGIVLAIVSWLILLFIQNFTGAQVTEFRFGF